MQNNSAQIVQFNSALYIHALNLGYLAAGILRGWVVLCSALYGICSDRPELKEEK